MSSVKQLEGETHRQANGQTLQTASYFTNDNQRFYKHMVKVNYTNL